MITSGSVVRLLVLGIALLLCILAGCSSSGGGTSNGLTRIQVTPGVFELPTGVKLSYTATGVYRDNTTSDLTTLVTWTSSDATKAIIDSSGMATSKAAGTTTITATITGISGTAILTVDGSALKSIQVTPENRSIAVQTKQQFTATGTFSDGDSHDLTTQVAWTSSDNSRATITSTGMASGMAAGATTITATISGISGSTTLTVDASTLKSIQVTPAAPSIAVQSKQQFTATGTFSDGHNHDLTTQVTWTSSDASKATITSAGLASGLVAGAATITATMSGISGSATLTVDTSTLKSIQVAPAAPSIAVQAKQQFTATGTFSDGDSHDLTTQVSWTSSDTSRATITSTGLTSAIAMGAATITATMSGISGSAALTVTGSGSAFPVYADNVFSIQYRNTTSAAITVWFIGNKPPCSKAEADKINCDTGSEPSQYSSKWTAMSDVFTRSGTAFYITRTSGVSEKIAVANKVDLAKGEVLRIIPPIVTGTDPVTGAAYTRPEWYYNEKIYENGVYLRTDVKTSGLTTWVTKTGSTMTAPQSVMLYEYNISAPLDKNIWYDIGAVDGLNANATMIYTGCSSAQQKVCKTNLSAYDGANDGCPYSMQFSSANVCPNPKFYTTIDSNRHKPSWVASMANFTPDDAASKYATIWQAAGSPSGADMASAPSGLAAQKKAYHIWWATNPVAQGWLAYLQKNKAGFCDAYGWAYDEMRWIPSDCDPNTETCFDANGNPAKNQAVKALISCSYSPNSYVNIDILDVM